MISLGQIHVILPLLLCCSAIHRTLLLPLLFFMALCYRLIPRRATIDLICIVAGSAFTILTLLTLKPLILCVPQVVEFEQTICRVLDDLAGGLERLGQRFLSEGLLS